jgi:hypothetical protein
MKERSQGTHRELVSRTQWDYCGIDTARSGRRLTIRTTCTLISLGTGKKMYTLSARADAVDSGFGLDNYPFTSIH